MSGANDVTTVGSGNDEWRTPPELFGRLNGTFQFDYDAFASRENALCDRYSTLEGTFRTLYAEGRSRVLERVDESLADGLTYAWGGQRVFMNPPYSRGFIEKAMTKAAAERNHAEVIVALIPANTDTRWWHDLVLPNASYIEFLRGRVRFLRPDGTPGDAPPNGSALACFFPDWRSK